MSRLGGGFWALVFGVLAFGALGGIDHSLLTTHGLWSLVFGALAFGALAHWLLILGSCALFLVPCQLTIHHSQLPTHSLWSLALGL